MWDGSTVVGMEHGHGSSTTSTPPPDMPTFEAPVSFGSPQAAPPSGWEQPPVTGSPVGPVTLKVPMNAWSEWSLGLAALAFFGLVLGLVVLPRSFTFAADGTADTW